MVRASRAERHAARDSGEAAKRHAESAEVARHERAPESRRTRSDRQHAERVRAVSRFGSEKMGEGGGDFRCESELMRVHTLVLSVYQSCWSGTLVAASCVAAGRG